MSKLPGGSYLVLLIYFLLTAVGCLLIGGILPMIVLIFGLVMTTRSGDIDHLRASGRLICGYYSLLALLAVGGMVWHLVGMNDPTLRSWSVREHSDYAFGFSVAAGLFTFGWAMTRFILMPAFLPYGDVIAANGLWGKGRRAARADNGPGIIRSEKFHQFSVADELLKWSQLRDAGTVSQAEFDAARRKLLSPTG